MRGARGVLTVDDVQEYLSNERGQHVDRTTAWRWLKKLERDYGAKVVERDRKLTIDRKELERVVSIARQEKSSDPALTAEVAMLRERVTEMEARQNVSSRELAEFRRMANEWFKRRPVGA